MSLYQREMEIPALWQGQRIFLRFEAVAHRARVWVDKTLACAHTGGSSFEAELTGLGLAGKKALLTVAVDNRVDHSTLPAGNDPMEVAFLALTTRGIPSVEQAKTEQKLQNRPNFDFFNYCGIFLAGDALHHPQNPHCRCDHFRGLGGEGGLFPHNRGAGRPGGPVAVYDMEGRRVAEGRGNSGRLVIPEPQLWWPWPGTPYLYQAEIPSCGGGLLLQTFGLRTVRVEGTRLLSMRSPSISRALESTRTLSFGAEGWTSA